MLGLTRKTDLALVALAYLAQRHLDQEPGASAREIADAFAFPLPQLGNVLKELARARIVTSTRGASGGYELTADPRRIRLIEVLTAMEGPLHLTRCADRLHVVGQGCEIEAICPISGPVRRLQQRMAKMLEDVSLADLLGDEVDVPVAAVGVA